MKNYFNKLDILEDTEFRLFRNCSEMTRFY